MDYTTKISVLKRAIHNTADMCYGAMAARSCVLSEIAQSLQEDTKKINTVERLARHLNAEIPETVHSNYTNIVQQYLPDNVVIHIDNSDVIKPCGRAFEGLSRVRDGSKSTASKSVTGNGYYVTEATALTKSCHPVSVFSEVWSAESSAFTSGGEFAYTKKAVQSCVDRFGHATFVMDRGYDDNDVFRLLDRLDQTYVIRLKLNRKIRVNGKKYSVQELCANRKGKYATKVIYHGRTRKAKLSVVKGVLSGSDRVLSIIISAPTPRILPLPLCGITFPVGELRNISAAKSRCLTLKTFGYALCPPSIP